MSHGWTKTAAPRSSASTKTGNSSARSRFQSPTWDPICTPARPSSRTQRCSSRAARSGACRGTVPSPTNLRGFAWHTEARWSLRNRAISSAWCGSRTQYESMTGTVESTCAPTPAASHSRSRTAGSHTLLVTSRNGFPSSRVMRALQSPRCSRRTNPPYPNRSLQRGSSGGRMCVWTSTLRMHVAAFGARRVLRIPPVASEDGRELLHDVGQVERFPVQLVPAAVADPEESVELVGEPAPFQNQTDRVGRALWRVRHARREEEDLAFADGNVARLSVLQDAQHDVAFDLVEELLSLVDVIVAARVRPAHDRHHEIAVAFPDLRVSHRRLEQVAVLVDPAFEVERLEVLHGLLHGVAQSTVAMHFSSMAIGVGSAVTSTVVRQGCASLKCSAQSRL